MCTYVAQDKRDFLDKVKKRMVIRIVVRIAFKMKPAVLKVA